ncbi:hypothetical protein TSO221_15055 [Azospirillum sp. TSO22-1]|nr:hypothetical protein TSO221_15055 [Azospirillum sp. TSO22-1]
MDAAGAQDAALSAIRRGMEEIEARRRQRAAALAAEAATTARLRDAEEVRRGAGRALDKHDERRPSGLWAAITGRTRWWRQERERLEAVHDAAVRAERAAERDAAVSCRTVAAVGRDGRRDAERREALRRVEAAVLAGRRAVTETAGRGNIDAAVRLVRPPRPAPRDGHGTVPTPEPDAPGPRLIPKWVGNADHDEGGRK